MNTFHGKTKYEDMQGEVEDGVMLKNYNENRSYIQTASKRCKFFASSDDQLYRTLAIRERLRKKLQAK